MISYSKELLQAVKDGDSSKREQLAFDILQSNPITSLAQEVIDYLLTDNTPIALNEADYEKVMRLFRCRGIRPDGSLEGRGRNRRGSKQ